MRLKARPRPTAPRRSFRSVMRNDTHFHVAEKLGAGMDQDAMLLLARLCVAAVYLYSGIDKIVNWPWSIAFINGLRLPNAPLVLTGTIVVQLIGAAAII